MNIVKKVMKHIYHDYLMLSKIEDYDRILSTAQKSGYYFETIDSFDDVIREGRLDGHKYLISRRDVDTKAISILKKMLATEVRYGAKCSYFFRNKTMLVSLMRQISNCGGIASYHYEELATYAEMYHIKKPEEILEAMPTICCMFEDNIKSFRLKTGLPCTTVASHGDFINVKLGISNTEILKDEALRHVCGITREAYDEEQMQYVTCRIADHVSPDFAGEAIAAINRNEPVIYLLTHPRQWGAAPWANTKENMSRIIRGIHYK